jgi:choline kinase
VGNNAGCQPWCSTQWRLPTQDLLEFDGRSLLARHIETLQLYGIKQLSLGVGYQQAKID